MSNENPIPDFLPLVPPVHFNRNFLSQVVCEFRFPTLFELNTSTPPEAFARALRKEYPHYRHMVQETNVLGNVSSSNMHIFKSKNLEWSITLQQSALALETTRYDSYSKFLERIQFILTLAVDVIDSPFFTRIGIRYINGVPFDPANLESLRGLVRPDFVRDLIEQPIGIVHEFSNRISGTIDFGTYTFSHGIGQNAKTQKSEYLLDFDMSKEDVDVAEAVSTIDELHKRQFAMFIWSLGDKAKELLGASGLKGEYNVL